MSNPYLANYCLVAMPNRGDPRFEHTVILICDHNANGALGVVINKPIEVTLADLFNHLGSLYRDADALAMIQPVLWGGPLERERGFVIHKPTRAWDSSFWVSEEVALTTSKDILEHMAINQGPAEAIVAFGCARWSAGQLEREIMESAWLVMPSSMALLYDCPFKERWAMAGQMMGVDFKRITYETGHA